MLPIQDINEIAKELQEEIVDFLSEPTPDDPETIIMRGGQLQAYMGRLSKMLADAKYYQDNALVHYAEESKGKVASTVMNSYVKALCKSENRLVTILEKLLEKCKCENDWNRTLISKAKEEYKLNQSSINNS